MIRIKSIITGLQGAPYLSVHHFGGETPLAAQDAATAVRAWWDAIKASIITGTTITIDTLALQVVEATGTLVAAHAVTATPVAGTGSGEVAPFATQGLVRWRTGVYQDNREIRGRTFIPRPSEADSLGGIPASGYLTLVNAASAALIAGASTEFGVWSKPHTFKGSPRVGVFVPATVGQCWNQWAVLRSRRD